MTIASKIEALQTAKANIVNRIALKGVTVQNGTKLAGCPDLISAIAAGSRFDIENVANIEPIRKAVLVDQNGYIGIDLTKYFPGGNTNYHYAIVATSANFSNSGLGRVTFRNPASNDIGGRTYPTVTIGGVTWMAENLDYKFTGLGVGGGSSDIGCYANYYQNDETTYGVTGNKYGLLYNWPAVHYLDEHKSELIPGWHVPSQDEWLNLFSAVGGITVAGKKLKSTTGWDADDNGNDGNGDDSYNFCIKPAGTYDSIGDTVGSTACYWTGTEYGYEHLWAYNYTFTSNSNAARDLNSTSQSLQYSVRLVKDY